MSDRLLCDVASTCNASVAQSEAAPNESAPIIPGFEVGELIGRGGMGEVFRARDLELDREVALKILQHRIAVDSPAARRFVAEARITAQLQHPGIPAIYRVAVLPNGRPFLAMKLIKGQTLGELLKSNVRIHHLSLMESVAQTVGYAHAHDVIHRDLKPANVMVGAFGEVQVMDWGLAKVLTATSEATSNNSDPESTTAPTLIRHDLGGQTEIGSVLGTPSYMPPEQAAGETNRIGKASDVFGLGALWCKLLTGQPPFAGDDMDAVRRNAMRGKTDEAFARLDACGAEPEVIALCKECLSFEPKDRPADANQVAQRIATLREAAEERARLAELSRARAEVQSIEQAKRRRLLRVGLLTIILALAAGLATSVWQLRRAREAELQTSIERDEKMSALIAETKARKAENTARQRAFLALRSLADEVVEQKFAPEQGRSLTEEDRTFLRGVIAQFDAFAELQGDDVETRAVRAEGRSRIALMQHRLGDVKAAEANYDATIALQQLLVDESPSRLDFRQDLARSRSNRGLLRRSTGRLHEAAEDLDAALTLQRQLAATGPARANVLQQLGNICNNRGLLRRDLGDLSNAIVDLDAAIEARRRLTTEFPGLPVNWQLYAETLVSRAGLLRAHGRSQEAENDYAVALDVLGQLVKKHPNHLEFRRKLATCHNGRSSLRRSLGNLRGAVSDCGKALDLQRRLVAEYPGRADLSQDLAASFQSRGLLRQLAEQWPDAESDFVAANSLCKRLAADFPDRLELTSELARSHENLGSIRKILGRSKEAEKDFATALSLFGQLADRVPSNVNYRLERARAEANLGHLQLATGRSQEAEKTFASALGKLSQLAKENPGRSDVRQELGRVHNSRGIMRNDAGRWQEAEADYDAALRVRTQLAGEFPDQLKLRGELAATYSSRGILRSRQRRTSEARSDYETALRLQRELVAQKGGDIGLQNDLAGMLVNLAFLHFENGEFESAKKALEEGRPFHLAALKANSRNPDYRMYYHNHLSVLIFVRAALLDPEQVLQAVDTRRSVGWHAPSDAYAAAGLLAACIPIVGAHARLDAKQRGEAAQFYIDAAIKALRVAVDRGFKDASRLKKDSRWASFLERADFKQLLAEMTQRR